MSRQMQRLLVPIKPEFYNWVTKKAYISTPLTASIAPVIALQALGSHS